MKHNHVLTPLSTRRTGNAIPKAPFRRLVKDILKDHGEFRITENALAALQCDSEQFLISLFRESNRVARNRKGIKISRSDFQLVHDLATKSLEELMNEEHRDSFGNQTIERKKKDVVFSKNNTEDVVTTN